MDILARAFFCHHTPQVKVINVLSVTVSQMHVNGDIDEQQGAVKENRRWAGPSEEVAVGRVHAKGSKEHSRQAREDRCLRRWLRGPEDTCHDRYD